VRATFEKVLSISVRRTFTIFRVLLLCVLRLSCLAGPITLCAQQPPPPAEKPADIPSLQVTSRLVQVNVIVNDKHGNPVAGLTAKDFSVLDNGKPQEIHVFSAATNLPSDSSHPPLPSDTYTNRPEERLNVPASVTVILLDALNTEVADQTLARRQVVRMLQEIQPQEYVALYWLGNGLQILHDFTTDASSLRQALAGYESKSSRQLENSALADPILNTPNPSASGGQTSERQAFRLAFDQRVANQSTRDRVRSTVAALVAIASHLSSRPGRKNLVWVSSSFPINIGYDKFDLNWSNDTGEDFAGDVRRAARALAGSDIAVYPVDARGLLGSNVSAREEDDIDDHIADPSDTDTHLPVQATPESFDTMRLLAQRTGGKAFYGTNDIAGAIRHAMNDSRATYTLGYYPDNAKWDGRFHELKIKTTAPGAELRARSGYFAFPDAPAISAKNDRAVIAQLAASQLPATGIGLHVRVQAAETSGASAVSVEAHIDVHEIQMRQKAGHQSGALQSVFLQLDKTGRILWVDDRTFHLDFDGPTYDRVLRTGISDTRQVRILPNTSQVCVVVRDVANANIGSIYLPIAQVLPGSPHPNASDH
jgi:VWFA-related protein